MMPLPLSGPSFSATYIYQLSTGTLLAWGPDTARLVVALPAQMAAAGLGSVSGLPPLDDLHVWDTTQKTVLAVPVLTIQAYQFVLLFTSSEAGTIQASTDPQVKQWLLALSVTPTINLADPNVIAGVNGLAAKGIITTTRAAQILANQSAT